MGCVKTMLADVRLPDYPAPRLSMELNEGHGGGDVIHLQTAFWRIELTREEFREFAQSVVSAGRSLREMKETGTLPTGEVCS